MEPLGSGWYGLLALAGSRDEAYFEGTLLLGGVVLVAVPAVLLLSSVRSRVRRPGRMTDPMFSLAELRRLRDKGELTTAEHDALQRRALNDLRRTADQDR